MRAEDFPQEFVTEIGRRLWLEWWRGFRWGVACTLAAGIVVAVIASVATR